MNWYNIIKGEKDGGTCYRDAYDWMTTKGHEMGDSAKLAHATVTGVGNNVKGIEYGHAFILINDSFVIDVATGKELLIPKDIYYKTGNVKDVKLYTFMEMLKVSLEQETSGPWEGKWRL